MRGIKKNNKCGQNDIQRDFFIDRLYFRDYNEFIEEGKKMKCPFCGEADSKVIDSRPAEDGNSIRRRRQCNACQKRFTTY